MSRAGKLERIWIKRSHRGPMVEADRATLDTVGGLAQNADYGSERQVTLVEKEVWDSIRGALGDGVGPIMRRANLLVSGIALAESSGRVLRVGATRIAIRGETKPCHRMDEAYPGLQEALKPRWGAGAWGVVVAGGEICVGDEAVWESENATP